MKRKQLSIKKLEQYVADFIYSDYVQVKYNRDELAEIVELLHKYLDYIWKNPR